MKFGIGQSVRRKEDPRFLTGQGKYIDDINLTAQTRAAILFSQHAHALIKSIDVSAARDAEGVVAVLTGQDYVNDGMGPILPEMMPEDMGGPKGYRTQHYPLATDRVRYVGQRVAVVVAETEAQARDALDLIEVDYEPLPHVVDAVEAVKEGAPLVHEEAGANSCFTLKMGNGETIDEVIENADHVIRLTIPNNRLTAVTMEPRGCIGEFSEGTDRYTLYSSTQNVHGLRAGLSHQVLKVPESQIRVVARDVGGGFGMKGGLYPEEAIVLWAAKKIGRPVKWIATRAEAFLADDQGRDLTVEAVLALDKEGNIQGLKWDGYHNLGAYIDSAGCVPVLFAPKLAPTVYDIPVVSVSNTSVFTNTVPTIPYRGAGRPEAVYIIERLMDAAARELNMDRGELRQKNFITPDQMPYETKTGWLYDSGNYAQTMEKCRALADWDGYDARQKQSQEKNRTRGRALIYYVDNTGIFNDRMEMRFGPDGNLTILSGVLNHGQGHETSFAQMASDWLGIPFENIRLVQADTDAVAVGRGTYASRSTMVGGSALRAAADQVIANGKKFAAHFLEADADEIEFEDGTFRVPQTNKSMTTTEVAKRAAIKVGVPGHLGACLEGVGAFWSPMPSFPNGCHICEVEVDPETGEVAIDRYTVVDDIGNVINPLLASAQIHGGVAQGVGQALMENIAYDQGSGQLVSGTLMDYSMPRADCFPELSVDFNPIPSTTNPIGVKGVGEGGTVAATPCTINAIVDALSSYGVHDITLPASASKIWQAMNAQSA